MTKNTIVLILVLMEDALRDVLPIEQLLELLGLNPCSNGRCSARLQEKYQDVQWMLS